METRRRTEGRKSTPAPTKALKYVRYVALSDWRYLSGNDSHSAKWPEDWLIWSTPSSVMPSPTDVVSKPISRVDPSSPITSTSPQRATEVASERGGETAADMPNCYCGPTQLDYVVRKWVPGRAEEWIIYYFFEKKKKHHSITCNTIICFLYKINLFFCKMLFVKSLSMYI